ncbi:hypothetical protein KY290_026150 [Solanum tuberosum]|uniref:Uncharacterized protein n=1 Tax=Solanum tuberosum TaxID=4113 RepID=A0ABQ7UVL0_SOLTU|nr:hypothetical protein KY289_025244 [Solanum tuberosum]KAH0677220.1 hypothetical protein KY285_025021 [Solanum tuberosum]KAH0755880.1 hypothetical protein KY290_026150 [Solanum tuberosum]
MCGSPQPPPMISRGLRLIISEMTCSEKASTTKPVFDPVTLASKATPSAQGIPQPSSIPSTPTSTIVVAPTPSLIVTPP